jgi:signal transduction histidine kinase
MQIEISDSGPGIRPPLLSRIFHPFFSTKTGHLGMGLTFTRQIMEELGGSVETASSVNQGTTVTMRLPGDRRRPIRTTPLEETAQGAPEMEPSD